MSVEQGWVSFVMDRAELAWEQSLSALQVWLWLGLKQAFFFSVNHPFWTLFALVWAAPGLALRLLYEVYSVPGSVLALMSPVLADPPPPPALFDYMSIERYAWICSVVVLLLTVIVLILRPRRVVRVCEHGFVVEKSVDGSIPIQCPPSDLQGVVWTVREGKRSRQGVFFRVADYLYLVGHTFLGAERVILEYKGKEQDLTAVPEEVDFDFYRVAYEPFSHWQMASGKFPKRSAPTFAQVHNGTVATFGLVKPSPTVGYVDYSGTTLPGFSGAPYLVGKTIVGVHVGCGAVNLGLDGAHITSVLRGKFRPEAGSESTMTDPDSYYANQDQDKPVEYRMMANEMYEVRIGDQYRLYDEDEFEDLQRRHKRQGRAGFVPAYKAEAAAPVVAKFTHRDSENCLRPAVPVIQAAGPCLTSEPVTAPIQNTRPTEETILKRLSQLENLVTDGLASIRVQQKQASAPISEEVLSLVKELQRLGIGQKTLTRARKMLRSGSLEDLRKNASSF